MSYLQAISTIICIIGGSSAILFGWYFVGVAVIKWSFKCGGFKNLSIDAGDLFFATFWPAFVLAIYAGRALKGTAAWFDRITRWAD